MERDALIKKVLARMDEVSHADSVDIVPDPTISMLLDDGIDTFLLMVPNHLIKDHIFDFIGNPTNAIDHYTGTIDLPEDYLKLVIFKMHTWKRPVTKAIYPDDPDYKLQSNKYLRGTPDRPVAAIRVNPVTGSQMIEYYSTTSNDHSVTEALCVTKTTPEELQDNLTDAFTWYVAATAYGTMGDERGASFCIGKLNDFIQSNTLINSASQRPKA